MSVGRSAPDTVDGAPDRFDFDALRFRTARFGQAALTGLAEAPDPEVARRAPAAERRTYPGEDLGDAGAAPYDPAGDYLKALQAAGRLPH